MAHCPNINLQEWKDLVESVGEVDAYAAYIKNGYEIPSLTEEGNYMIADAPIDEVVLDDIDKDSTFLKQITKVRGGILSSLRTKFDIYEGSKKSEEIADLKKLIKEFKEADIIRSMFIYSKTVDKQIDQLSKRMDGKNTIGFIKQLDDFAGTFYMMEEVVKLMEGRSDVPDKHKAELSRVLGKVGSFKKKYLEYSKEAMIDSLADQSTLARAKAKTKYAREFEKNHPEEKSTLSKADYVAKKKEYVKNLLNENRDKILTAEKRHIRDILTTAPKDISALTRLMIDPRGVNDHLIQLAVNRLDKADFNAKEDFIKARNEALAVWEPFTKGQTGIITTKQKELYEGIIEKIDGKETNYYVREYLSTYYKALNAKIKAENGTNTPAERRAINEAFQKDFPQEKYKNPQFDALNRDSKKKGMYEYLIDFNAKSDNLVPRASRLGYRLPSVSKTLSETTNDEGIIEAVKRTGKDLVNLQKDDHTFGDLEETPNGLVVATDERGNALRRVAVPFRMDMEAKDQSYDLMGIALTNRFVSLNYSHKNNARIELEIIEDLMKEREIVKHSNSGDKLLRKLGVGQDESDEHQSLTDPGATSQSHKLMHDLLEDRLYGRHNVKAGSIAGMDIDKMTNLAVKWSAHTMLSANYAGGAANVLAGKVMNFFEGTRGVHYSRSDLRAAEGKYIGDFTGWSSDIGRPGQPKSKTNLLVEKFIDTSMDFSGYSNKLTNDSKFKSMFSVGTLHGINGSAEHYIQSTLVYALLNNTKVTNKNGEFIDKDGNVTANRKNAMTMDQAYETDNGLLKWKNKDYSIEGFDEFDGNVEFALSIKMKDIVGDLQGNYDDNNRAQVQRYWYGKLGMFLRKWMVRGIQRRYRGAGVKGENLEDRAFYSEATGEFKEGTYVSTAHFIHSVWKQSKMIKMQTYSEEWSKLTDIEKANIKSAAWELGVMATAFASSAFLAALAEGTSSDEEEELLYGLAYLTRRQYSELMFFLPVSPMEALRLAKSPSATMSLVEQVSKTFGQLFEDIGDGEMEVYDRGQYAGDTKQGVNMMKLWNPVQKQMNADMKKKYGYLVNN
tara:strand:- start:2 stop:3199 length:3198 start_codon:yes stop_codon:yes gene_type:complete